ncbi:hypothetical protein BJY00DRAFT_309796 [Aspergillus carlsbadensis]|nr:hypothetical protein BJY00DRAFT_309796 [Aspergillus carlsbadensis]
MTDLTALDLSQRSPRVKWTDDMRKVLCCLLKYYVRDKNAFLNIFYSCFQQELIDSGFTDGKVVGWSRLESQWVDMKKHGDYIWENVHCLGFDREPWLPVLDKIEGAATALGLTMTEKEHDTIDSSQFVYNDRVRQSPSQLGQHSREVSSDIEPEEVPVDNTAQYEFTEGQRLDTNILCTAGGKACFWCHLEGLDQEETGYQQVKIPQLLYRWWNVDSQGVNSRDLFVAGLFTSTSMLAPDTISKEEFKLRFLNHISRKHISSPFISSFQSALSPIHRGLCNQEGATVSIIDSSKLKKSQVFSAKEFVQRNSVRIGRTYDGRGEYLIWGLIPKDAIICSFKITALREIAAKDLEIERFLQLDMIAAFKRARRPLHKAMEKRAMGLDQRTGATVGRLLSSLGVPCEYSKAISEGLAYSWRVKWRGKPWNDFNQGVDLGFRGERTLPSPSLSPATSSEDPLLFESIYDTASDDDEVDQFTDDEDNIVVPPRGINANPIARMFPIIDLEDRSATPFPRFSSVGLDNDVEEEELDIDGLMDDMADQDFDFFGELGQSQQEISTDQFANDRARVRSALEKLGPRR